MKAGPSEATIRSELQAVCRGRRRLHVGQSLAVMVMMVQGQTTESRSGDWCRTIRGRAEM